MVLNVGKRSKHLTFRKGWGVFIFTVLVFSTLVIIVDVQPTESDSGTYSEDFTTTYYMDDSYTSVAGWGSGTINLPLKTARASLYDTPDAARDVFVDDNHAYIAEGDSGLQVVDISDPTDPDNVSDYDTPGIAVGVFVSGDYAYVADGGYNQGLQVVDISDPENPTNASYYYTSDYAYSVFVDGNFAYIADGEAGLQIVNITDPVDPTLAGSYGYNINDARDVFVLGDYAYFVDISSLIVLDISDPTNPTYKGNFTTRGYAYGVFVDGDYAYIADGDSGLTVADISDPSNPTFAGFYDTEGEAWDVFVESNFAYVASDGDFGLTVVNISDPIQPAYAASYNISNYDHEGVFVDGDYAYLACGGSGLDIVKVMTNQFEDVAFAYSSTIAFSDLKSIIRATLTSSDSEPSDTNITYYLSATGNLPYENVTPGKEYSFLVSGHELKWMVLLQTFNSTKTPTISSLSITYYTEEDEFPIVIIGIIIGAVIGIGATVIYYKQKKKEI